MDKRLGHLFVAEGMRLVSVQAAPTVPLASAGWHECLRRDATDPREP